MMKFQNFAVFVAGAICLGAACGGGGDPWDDCPQQRQCLSGDIITDEAKFCCSDGQKCVGSENPEEGGSCKNLAEVDPWEDCPEERQCLSGDIVIDEAKFCCFEGQQCVGAPNLEEGGLCEAI